MKRIMLFALILIITAAYAIEIRIENPELDSEIIDGYTRIYDDENSFLENIPGVPAIPLLSKFIDLNSASEISNVSVIPKDIKIIELEKPLYPQQKPFAYSHYETEFIEPGQNYYEDTYPENWLKNSSFQVCGTKSLAMISIYSFKYDPIDNVVIMPSYFDVNITAKGVLQTEMTDNSATSIVLNHLGLSEDLREPSGYLIIAPDIFENTVQSLLDWRFKQGWDVYYRSLSEIELLYQGEDLPAKIRNCIADMQSTANIDFVTLAGDPELLPVRYAFAFDCAYGSHEGENDLACDMYYSCLDGNWNADADTLYGEDEDEVDLLPEVFVGRIPANDEIELNSYIGKLISYEKGLVDNYEVAGGLSMELWEGSSSEICQQYIYDNYFPSEYEIDFIYGDENNTDNAFAMINTGKNIIQHTGHAWTNILSLENYNRIYAHDVENLTYDWGGMFYSIGCWSNAFDYNSIGEAFVCTPERNFLGYIGNSSYGWGAPGAPAFGFSEFYQKEFFRILFRENQIELGLANALHKLAFIPYFNGTSVFKWVGYELNLCGDAAGTLNTVNPRDMQITVNRINYELFVTVLDNGFPIENAVISSQNERWLTDEEGVCQIPWNNGQEFNHSVFAKGYRWQNITNSDIVELPQINIEEIPEYLLMNTEQNIQFSVTNPGQETINFSISAECEQLNLQYNPEILYSAAQGITVDIPPIGILYEGSENLADSTIFEININIHDSGEVLAERSIRLYLKSGDFNLTNVTWDQADFIANNQMPIEFEFTSDCELENINFLEIQWLNPDDLITYEVNEMLLYPENIIDNQIFYAENNLLISSNIPEDYFNTLQIILTVNWAEDNEWHHTYAYCIGNAALQIEETFDDEFLWDGDDAWQTVATYSVSGENSLSCRPDSAGHYYISSPILSWVEGSTLSFNYKYKMPMYGEDGFMLRLVGDAYTQDIVFLGSGGALIQDLNRPESQVYIEGEWQNFSFDLDELLLETPGNGDSWQLQFDFFCSEIIPGFSDYAEMPEVGVFIDDFMLEQTEFISENSNKIPAEAAKIYPNPFYANDTRSDISIELSNETKSLVKLDLYDIRGRHLIRISNQIMPAGRNVINFNVSKLASGVYFLKLSSEEKSDFSKFVILR